MARDNYSYQKYRRELAKKKKKEEKIQRKLAKKNAQPDEGLGQSKSIDPTDELGADSELGRSVDKLRVV